MFSKSQRDGDRGNNGKEALHRTPEFTILDVAEALKDNTLKYHVAFRDCLSYLV